MTPIAQVFSLRDSAEVATAGTETSTVTLNGERENLTIIVDATALDADAGDTLKVYIDTSFDGGTSFVNIGLVELAGDGSAEKNVLHFNKANIESTNPTNITSDLSSEGTRQIGFGNKIRYRGIMAEDGDNGAFTYAVTGRNY